MADEAEEEFSTANYYSLIKRYLKKQYSDLDEKEIRQLCRRVIFAPKNDAPMVLASIGLEQHLQIGITVLDFMNCLLHCRAFFGGYK